MKVEISSKIRGVTGRILAVYLVIFILFGLVVILTDYSLEKIEVNTDLTAAVQVPRINMANEIKTAVLFQQLYVKKYIDRENPLEAKAKFREDERLIQDRLRKLAEVSKGEVDRKMIDKVRQEYEEYTLVVNTIFKLDPGRTTLTQVLMTNYAVTAGNINQLTDALVQNVMTEISSSTAMTNTYIDKLSKNNLAVSLIALLAGLFAIWRLSTWISRPVNSLVTAIGLMAQGNLAQKVETCGITEFDTLGSSFNHMIGTLRQLVFKISQAATEVSSSSVHLSQAANDVNQVTLEVASGMETFVANGEQETENMNRAAMMLGQVNRTIDEIADRVQQQADNIKSSTEAVREIAIMAQEVNGKAEHLTEVSRDTVSMAENGGDTVERAMSGMDEIKTIVSSSAQAITSLVKQSEEIGKTVQLIGEIADQTNLLALNARIEAARAGEAGKGFAVIAEQVRILADKSRAATQQVSDSVNTVRKGISDAVAAMEQIESETDRGGVLVKDAGQVLAQIMQQIRAAIAPIQEISVLIDNVTNMTGDVVVAMSNVAELAQNNAVSSQQTADRTTEINQIVEQANSTVQDNVKAAKEVSVHTEMISVSTHEVAASAGQLSETSVELQRLIAEFNIEEQGGQ